MLSLKRKNRDKHDGISTGQPSPKIQTTTTMVREAINVATTTARQLTIGPKFRNQLVGKIVEYLKVKFLQLEESPLELDVILKAIDEDNIAESLKTWLLSNAATISECLKLEDGRKFSYIPPLPCRDRDSLIALLKEYNYRSYGGIYRTDIENSISNSEMVLRSIANEILTISGPDKVQVVFYNDRSLDLGVSQFVKELWNSIDDPDMKTISERLIEDGQSVMGTFSSVDEKVPKKRRNGTSTF